VCSFVVWFSYYFRFLYIPLVCAERAWALGMELKQAANTEHRKRFHLMRRLQRAVKHASELVQLCERSERCDARTRLEAQVSGCSVSRMCVCVWFSLKEVFLLHAYMYMYMCNNTHLWENCNTVFL
jgi:hypothetical protein